jgi:hypothetical protein
MDYVRVYAEFAVTVIVLIWLDYFCTLRAVPYII